MSSKTRRSHPTRSKRRLSCLVFLVWVTLSNKLVMGQDSAAYKQGKSNTKLVTPPAGLFERLDLNHDTMLSVEEYTNGWPLIADQFPFGEYWFLPAYKGGFWKGFTSGVAMILATEIGDKTFFIAAVLSMRQK
jgi:hypothetical protein